MKKVKFNASTSVLMIPDEQYKEYIENLKQLKRKDPKSFIQSVQIGTEYMTEDVKIGTVTEVPDWYYNAHKDRIVAMSVHYPNKRDRGGNIIPYNVSEMKDSARAFNTEFDDRTTKDVKLFELVGKVGEK